METDGINLGHKATANDVADNFKHISNFDTAKHYAQQNRAFGRAVREDRRLAQHTERRQAFGARDEIAIAVERPGDGRSAVRQRDAPWLREYP